MKIGQFKEAFSQLAVTEKMKVLKELVRVWTTDRETLLKGVAPEDREKVIAEMPILVEWCIMSILVGAE